MVTGLRARLEPGLGPRADVQDSCLCVKTTDRQLESNVMPLFGPAIMPAALLYSSGQSVLTKGRIFPTLVTPVAG